MNRNVAKQTLLEIPGVRSRTRYCVHLWGCLCASLGVNSLRVFVYVCLCVCVCACAFLRDRVLLFFSVRATISATGTDPSCYPIAGTSVSRCARPARMNSLQPGLERWLAPQGKRAVPSCHIPGTSVSRCAHHALEFTHWPTTPQLPCEPQPSISCRQPDT